jgi:hypothetical protein
MTRVDPAVPVTTMALMSLLPHLNPANSFRSRRTGPGSCKTPSFKKLLVLFSNYDVLIFLWMFKTILQSLGHT